FVPPPRPAPAGAPAAPVADDGLAVGSPPTPYAQHAHEICGFESEHGHNPVCKLVANHDGAHLCGTPKWMAGGDGARRVTRCRDGEASERAPGPAMAGPATPAGQIGDLRRRLERLVEAQAELGYALDPAQRDQVDPAGAQERAHARELIAAYP